MSKLFGNHYPSMPVYKHRELPLLETGEFDFYRCVPFKSEFYGKTVSELHEGNLRLTTGRYSKLFPNKKLSYWAEDRQIARAEVKKHSATNSLLTFFAYDDATATFPTLSKERNFLRIIDGVHFGFIEIMQKVENNYELSKGEKDLLRRIEAEQPDCLAYESVIDREKTNFIFFEKGFNKLAIRDVHLRIEENGIVNINRIYCASGCDYTAFLERYGDYFLPKAKVRSNPDYINSEEYKTRKEIMKYSYDERQKAVRKGPHVLITVDPNTGKMTTKEEEGESE